MFQFHDEDPDEGRRLQSGYDRVCALLSDHQERSLRAITNATGVPEASASAHIRTMRKRKMGSHTVTKRYVGNGVWLYRFVA